MWCFSLGSAAAKVASQKCCGEVLWKGGKGGGWEGNFHHHLLSHQVGSVSRFHLERTVLGPEVDRVGDAGAAPLIDLIAMLAAA